MNYKSFQDIKLSTLGMGNMRLPMQKDDPSKIDYVASQEIIDYAMANGINYYDTAYVYNNGESEKFVGHALKKYKRETFYLATKYHVHANPDYKAVFEEQLRRLQTEYIDFYLIHCIMDGNIDTYLENGCIDYFLEMKRQGKIRYLGFSSHASVETLERFASHHAWDFAQLQINYYDWTYGKTQKEYEVLKERNIPIMVMEPVRGGRLATLTDETNAILKEYHPNWSIAKWALRFVQTLPQVQVVLSGMSALDQIVDNVETFSGETGLTKAEMDLLLDTLAKFRNQVRVPCTACRYCCEGCPVEINIPEVLRVYNTYKVDGRWALGELNKIDSKGKPEDCIACGQCKVECPQGINIPEIMEELASLTKK